MAQYAIKERSDGSATSGPFLRLVLGNATDQVKAVYWGVPPEIAAVCTVGAIVDVMGEEGEYRGERQLKIISLSVLPPDQVDLKDFLPASPFDSAMQQDRLNRLIAGVKDPHLGPFLSRVFGDADFYGRYVIWPAAMSIHHAWVGGLLDHVLEVAAIGEEFARRWSTVDRDLIVAGALLHDVGKLEEYSMSSIIGMTDAGRLAGHIALGVEWLIKITATVPLPAAAFKDLRHLILSHHGQIEWGAPVLPKTPTAIALHLADLASGRMAAAEQAVLRHSKDEPWTEWVKSVGTSLYVG